jgi:hypothetical protein
MSDQAKSSVGWTVWLWWVLASAGGGAAGFAAADALLGFMSAALQRVIAEVVIFGLIVAGLGTMQWLVLRNLFSQAGWWVVASTVGGAIVGVGAAFLSSEIEASLIIAYGLSGIILGMLQWIVLRRQTSRAWLWILASPLGWAIAVPTVGFLDQMGQDVAPRMSETVGLILAFGLMGAVVGFVTGGVLVWMLRKPNSALRCLDPIQMNSV